MKENNRPILSSSWTISTNWVTVWTVAKSRDPTKTVMGSVMYVRANRRTYNETREKEVELEPTLQKQAHSRTHVETHTSYVLSTTFFTI